MQGMLYTTPGLSSWGTWSLGCTRCCRKVWIGWKVVLMPRRDKIHLMASEVPLMCGIVTEVVTLGGSFTFSTSPLTQSALCTSSPPSSSAVPPYNLVTVSVFLIFFLLTHTSNFNPLHIISVKTHTIGQFFSSSPLITSLCTKSFSMYITTPSDIPLTLSNITSPHPKSARHCSKLSSLVNLSSIDNASHSPLPADCWKLLVSVAYGLDRIILNMIMVGVQCCVRYNGQQD